MAERVTIQNIADALGVSRNTVSKAINNTGVLAEKTREMVLRKAVEMGYKQFTYVHLSDSEKKVSLKYDIKQDTAEAPATPIRGGVISLLTPFSIDSSHFASTMLDKFQRELTENGYSLMIHRITEQNLRELSLPASFNPEAVSGVLCIELFHTDYCRFLCTLGLPTLFVDAPVSSVSEKFPSDILLMDNRTEILSLVHRMAGRGVQRFGFIGEIGHCRSFYERYSALREGLLMLNIPYDERFTISSGRTEQPHLQVPEYHSFLEKELRELPELPEVFLCANDFVALDALTVFRKLNIAVPDQVCLCGFDDSVESRVVTPPLTTVHIHSRSMGHSAFHLLLSRIKNPSANYRTVYTETTLYLRESTRDIPAPVREVLP